MKSWFRSMFASISGGCQCCCYGRVSPTKQRTNGTSSGRAYYSLYSSSTVSSYRRRSCGCHCSGRTPRTSALRILCTTGARPVGTRHQSSSPARRSRKDAWTPQPHWWGSRRWRHRGGWEPLTCHPWYVAARIQIWYHKNIKIIDNWI